MEQGRGAGCKETTRKAASENGVLKVCFANRGWVTREDRMDHALLQFQVRAICGTFVGNGSQIAIIIDDCREKFPYIQV